MTKNKKIALIGGLILIGLLLVYFFGLKRSDTYVTNKWDETYSPKDKGPYGTYVMKELLDTVGFFGEFIEIDNELSEGLKDDENINDIYFFIGKQNYMSGSSCLNLLNFVSDGNTAFIAAEKIPDDILNSFFLNINEVYKGVKSKTQKFKFTHHSFRKETYVFDYIYKNEKTTYNWQYFVNDNFEVWEDGQQFTLGKTINGNINFIKFTYGEGQIYFHSNPYIFTNVAMLRKNGFLYAEHVLKHIPPGRIQWDRYNIERHFNFNNNNQNGEGDIDRRSILEFIFKNPSLTWAFVILLIAAFLYMIFKGKRMQDVVKPAELKENTSLRYIKTISDLYLQEHKHGKLIAHKEKIFKNYIEEKYYLSTHKIDDNFYKRLAKKSEVEEQKIKDIFVMFNKLKGKEVVMDEVLIQLHHKIEYFYQNCK